MHFNLVIILLNNPVNTYLCQLKMAEFMFSYGIIQTFFPKHMNLLFKTYQKLPLNYGI